MMNSFNLTLSGKHFICPSILNDSFAGYSNLGCRSLFFITRNTSCQPLLACKVSLDKSADSQGENLRSSKRKGDSYLQRTSQKTLFLPQGRCSSHLPARTVWKTDAMSPLPPWSRESSPASAHFKDEVATPSCQGPGRFSFS